MQPISTKITQLLDIQSPIIAAPMAFASTADLAAAVTGKGGYGFVGAGACGYLLHWRMRS